MDTIPNLGNKGVHSNFNKRTSHKRTYVFMEYAYCFYPNLTKFELSRHPRVSQYLGRREVGPAAKLRVRTTDICP
jgi:hypothetical protein